MWTRSTSEGDTCPWREMGGGAASEAYPAKSPLGVTVPDRRDLANPLERPEVQAALTSRG